MGGGISLDIFLDVSTSDVQASDEGTGLIVHYVNVETYYIYETNVLPMTDHMTSGEDH